MSSVGSATSTTVQTDGSAPVCQDDENFSDEEINAIEAKGDSVSDGHVEMGSMDSISIVEPAPLEAPDPMTMFSSSPLDAPVSGYGGGGSGGYGGAPEPVPSGGDGVDTSPEPTVSPDATIPEPLAPKKPLTSVMDGYRQANGQPVVGLAVQGTAAVPLSPFGFGGGVSGSVGLVWDRFGGIGISMGGSAMAGWGVNVGVGLNASVSTGGTILGNHDIWQSSGGGSLAAGPIGVDYQPGQMGSGLGVGVGIGAGAWGQANTQTVIPIIEPTLVFVNGELLVPGR